MSDEDPVYSLDDEVKKWIWEDYANRNGRLRAIFHKCFYEVDVCWSNVVTSQDEVTYKAKPSTESVNAQNLPNSPPRDRTQTTFISSYENDSPQTQQFTLEYQQTLRNTWKVSLSKCVTQGGTCSFTLKVPNDILEAGGTYSVTREVTEAKEQTFENEVTWRAASQVNVGPKARSTAFAVSTTCCDVKTFELTKFYRGKVIVRFKPKLAKTWRHSMQRDIQDIFLKSTRFPRHDNGCKATIAGECSFEYCAKQCIIVSEKDLSEKGNDSQQPSAKSDSKSKLKPVSEESSTESDIYSEQTPVKA